MNEIFTFSNTISTHGGLGGAEVQKYSILPYFCDGDAIFDIVLLSEETNEKYKCLWVEIKRSALSFPTVSFNVKLILCGLFGRLNC